VIGCDVLTAAFLLRDPLTPQTLATFLKHELQEQMRVAVTAIFLNARNTGRTTQYNNHGAHAGLTRGSSTRARARHTALAMTAPSACWLLALAVAVALGVARAWLPASCHGATHGGST
jgi:hypothetical protein